MSITETFEVAGMTCGHCVQAVTTEVMMIDGVQQVVIDLESGGLAITSAAGVDAAAVKDAVEEAGYDIVA